MKVPIPNTVENQLDPSYRYLRDELVIVKQGQFYVLTNIDVISTQIKISIDKIKNYFTSKLNQPIILDKKTNQLKIKNIPTDFNILFDEFINYTVVCNNCNKPEVINNCCESCGFASNLSKK